MAWGCGGCFSCLLLSVIFCLLARLGFVLAVGGFYVFYLVRASSAIRGVLGFVPQPNLRCCRFS